MPAVGGWVLHTPCVSPAGDPAVVARLQVDLLARQAGVADEVGWLDFSAGPHQGDVVVQLAVRWVTEVLVPVDALDWEHALCFLRALQLVLTQDDPPTSRILSLPSVEC